MPSLPMTLLVRKPDSATSASEFSSVILVSDIGKRTAVKLPTNLLVLKSRRSPDALTEVQPPLPHV